MRRYLLMAFFVSAQGPASTTVYLDALRQARAGDERSAFDALIRLVQSDPSFARAYTSAVSLARKLGRIELARERFEKLIETPAAAPYAHYGMAFLHSTQKKFDAAERHIQRAIELAPAFVPAYEELVFIAQARGRVSELSPMLEQLSQTRPDLAGPWYALSALSLRAQDWQKSIDCIRKARQSDPHSLDLAQFEHFILVRMKRYRDALEVLQQMLAGASSTSDLDWEGRILGLMGITQSTIGEYRLARSNLIKAVEIAQDSGAIAHEQMLRGNLGAVYYYLGSFELALEECRRAAALSRSDGDRRNEGRNVGLIASVQLEMGVYAQAIEAYEQAIRLARETGDRSSEADQLASLSLLHLSLGGHEQALKSIQQALELAPELKNPWLEGRFHKIHGSVYKAMGRHADAATAYGRSLKLSRTTGDRYAEASALTELSATRSAGGDRQGAWKDAVAALDIAKQSGAHILEGRIHVDLGRLELTAGRLPAAEAHYRQAQSFGEQTRMPEVLWRAEAGLARVHERRGQWSEARALYARSVDIIEELREGLPVAEEKAGFLEDKIDPYKNLVRVLLALHVRNPRGDFAKEAFHYTERARARAFLDLLAESGRGRQQEAGERLREAQWRISHIQSELMREHAVRSPDQKKIASLYSSLAQADDAYVALSRALRRSQVPAQGQALRLEQVQKLLGPRALLLEYSLGESQSFLFAVSRDGFRHVKLPPAGVLAERVDSLRRAIAKGRIRAALGDYLIRARALYQDLIQPAGTLLQGKNELIIVPDGALHYAPFAALLHTGQPLQPQADMSQLPYLVRSHALRYSPSASVLAALAENRGERPAPEKMLLAFADPDYNGAHQPGATRSSYFGKWERLPASRKEAESIAAVYPSGQVTLFAGREASERNAKTEGLLANHRILHFAVHGFVNHEKPQLSGLVLSQSEGQREDGLLQAYEIMQMRLNAGVVVLSACETGIGKHIRGEGLASLSRSFLYAGASSVIASLWRVDDQSTADLMFRFHRHLFDGKTDRDEALRQAQLDLIRSGKFAHPFYWAAFVLTGSAR